MASAPGGMTRVELATRVAVGGVASGGPDGWRPATGGRSPGAGAVARRSFSSSAELLAWAYRNFHPLRDKDPTPSDA